MQEVKAQCRPGYIEIPFDIVDMPIQPPVIPNLPQPESDPDNLEASIEDAVDMINNAERPVIIADVELHRHNLSDLASGIAKKFNIPIAATLLSKSVISEQNPLYIGTYSGGLSQPETRKIVEDSDCIIMLGAFITDVFLGLNTAELERKRTIVATTEKTSIGLRRYDQILFRDFLEKLLYSNLNKRPDFTPPATAQAATNAVTYAGDDKISVECFFTLLNQVMPEESTVVCDTGDALIGAIGLRTTGRKNFLSDAYYLSMGFAVPASIGAMTANPTARTIVIAGDGAFQMTGIELSTAAKENMAPIVFILNNDGYGTQRHIIDGPFNNIHPWDYTRICDLLRYGTAYKVETMAALEEAVDTALNNDEMALIEVVLPRDDCSPSLRRLGEELGKLRDSQKQ